MYVVDASVWVSGLVFTDQHHRASFDWLKLVWQEPFMEPVVLLPEIGGPLARITGQSAAAARMVSVVQGLSHLTLFPISESLARFTADLAAELRLRGCDALYVALASRMGIPLVTWDNQQLQRGSRVASTTTPSELLSGSSPT